MNTTILLGKPVSEKIRTEIKSKIEDLKNQNIIPKISVILVGEDAASQIYVKMKHRTFLKYNCKSEICNFPENVSKIKLINLDSTNSSNNQSGKLEKNSQTSNSNHVIFFFTLEKNQVW